MTGNNPSSRFDDNSEKTAVHNQSQPKASDSTKPMMDATVEFKRAISGDLTQRNRNDEDTVDFSPGSKPTADATIELQGTQLHSDHVEDAEFTGEGFSNPEGVLVAALRREVTSSQDTLQGRLIGEFEIQRELGRGGMGVVYQARHKRLRRDVAIKMILGGNNIHREAKSRFIGEAQAVAALQHPNIVQLFEYGEHQGNPYFALEFVNGGTLSDRLVEHPLEPKEAAKIVETLARAMAVAHQKLILHRDLKPANVLLTSDGIPKISDFGLAKQLVDNDQVTRTGTIMGTPSYMSPEQAKGETNLLTPATDQYSLGAILYACLAGRPPFLSSSTIDTISQVVGKEPIPLRQMNAAIPIDLDTICAKALQKDPTKRYADCIAFADDLKRYTQGQPILARPIGRIEKSFRWCKRNPLIAIASSSAALSLVAVALISTWAWSTTAAQSLVITQERDDARTQRAKANEQKLLAEENEVKAKRQAVLALQSIQLVATSINDELQKNPGTTDLRIKILELLKEKWDEIDASLVGGLRGEAIPTLLKVQHLIANARLDLGKVEDAHKDALRLVEMERERVTIRGRSRDSLANLATGLLFLSSTTAKLQGAGAASTAALEEALKLMLEVDELPADVSVAQLCTQKEKLAGAAQNYAASLVSLGQLQKARANFELSLASNLKSMELKSKEPEFQKLSQAEKDQKLYVPKAEAERAQSALAYTEIRLNQLDSGVKKFEALIQSQREFAVRYPKLMPLRANLAGSSALFGKCLLWIGKFDEAGKILMESVQLWEEMTKYDPEKTLYRSSLANALYQLASTRELQGHNDEAVSLYERSRLIRQELAATTSDQKSKIALMLSEASMGNKEAAEKLIGELENPIEKNAELHIDRARALGKLASLAKDAEDRKTLIDQATKALRRSVDEGFKEAFRISHEVELKPLANESEFKAILASLAGQQ